MQAVRARIVFCLTFFVSQIGHFCEHTKEHACRCVYAASATVPAGGCIVARLEQLVKALQVPRFTILLHTESHGLRCRRDLVLIQRFEKSKRSSPRAPPRDWDLAFETLKCTFDVLSLICLRDEHGSHMLQFNGNEVANKRSPAE